MINHDNLRVYRIGFLFILKFSFRFAEFFISPLFDENAKDREVNAVNSGIHTFLQYNLLNP